jgi:hypothetical protein
LNPFRLRDENLFELSLNEMNEFLERELKVDPAGEGIPLTERELCEWGQVRSADEGADWPGESYEALVERVTSGIFEKFSFF